MAPRKKKAAAPAAELRLVAASTASDAMDDDEQEEFEAIDAMEGGDLSRAIESVTRVSGAFVEVVKVEDDRLKWCRNYPVAKFSNEQISTDFGAGTYRIRFKGPNKEYLKGGGTIDIAATLSSAATAGAGGSGVTDVLAIIKAEREKSKADWMEWAKLLAPLALPKLLDMFSGNKGPSLADLMAVIAGAKDFHKPAPQQSLESQLDQFTKLLDAAERIRGDKTDSTGATWVDLIRDGINQLPTVVGAVRSGIPFAGPLLPPPQPPPLPAPPIGAPTPSGSSVPAPAANGASSPAAPTEANGMDLRIIPWLKATLESLLTQAQNNRDPEMYAQVTLDNLPNYVTPESLLSMLNRADWWELAVKQDARLASHPGWFREYHEVVVELLQQAIKPPAAAGPGVNAAHPEDDFT